ncbi:Mitochondrial acidic protein mam33 [Dimargaris verticillata]|uniref:Mitochondrial acidic protein mam33 n=1 Tax=Dimargaris verticillata TaxID=2761393 RepID=A0A9W8EAS8_9FUNG|nr:Mitochondrial acidic protein mam33 [Dimargaris verticillata]
MFHALRRVAGGSALRASRFSAMRPLHSLVATPLPRTTLGLRIMALNRSLTTTPAYYGQGVADKDLVHALKKELSFEEENQESDLPEFLESFVKKDLFQIHDTPGHNEVMLTRTFGNETITVTFSISEIFNAEDTLDSEPEQYTPDQMTEEGEKIGESEEEPDFDKPEYPARFNVTIEKPNQSALSFDLTAESGDYGVDRISVLQNGKIAKQQTAEADYQRRGYYLGPSFGFLDEDLKVGLERFLEERGIDSELSLFIPDYIEYKEEKEYINWLNHVKQFVEA